MARHMLVQFPLLAAAGVWLLHDQHGVRRRLLAADPLGALALVTGTGMMLFWMLPLHLDLASIEPAYRLAKVVSVPIGIGACFYWAVRQSTLLVRLVIAFEAWAAVTRLGWIYLESPNQLCSNYLYSEQKTVGGVLLVISVVCATAAVLWALFGSFAEESPGSVDETDTSIAPRTQETVTISRS